MLLNSIAIYYNYYERHDNTLKDSTPDVSGSISICDAASRLTTQKGCQLLTVCLSETKCTEMNALRW
jgi:hypothetical protein